MNNIISYKLLGVRINLLSMSQLNSLIEETVKSNKKRIIANHNLNSIYIYHQNSLMRDFYKIADYTHIDGMPLVFMGKLLGIPCERIHRVTYVDWIWSLMSEAVDKKWRILYVGSKPGVGEKGILNLKKKYPDIEIKALHGYFSNAPDDPHHKFVIDTISSYQPHILMVGMGMPRQENWILNNVSKINTNVILPCGACMDYVAEATKTPPRWTGQVGLEWLYRLVTEPKRLWRRYLIEPWFIAFVFSKEYLTHFIYKKFRFKKGDSKQIKN